MTKKDIYGYTGITILITLAGATLVGWLPAITFLGTVGVLTAAAVGLALIFVVGT